MAVTDGILAASPKDEWPAWAKDLADQGRIETDGKVTVVHTSAGRITCKPGDYIGQTRGGAPVVMSAAVYEGGLRA